jgi:DNA-nicking Smr family endonuclease
VTRRRRTRHLTGEEIALWRHVTQDVTAAKEGANRQRAAEPDAAPRTKEAPAVSTAAPSAPAPTRRYEVAPYTPPAQTPRAKTQHPALHPLERPVRKRLSRGRLAVDAKIDLHGLRQDEAHHALRHFLWTQQSAGARIVIVVTGKGLTGGETGVLRRMAPHWLAAPEWRRFVSGFEPAGRAHGGDGAFYVRLRRAAAP